MIPSRWTVTRAVASLKGMRTWKRAVSPGWYSGFSGSTSMRSSSRLSNHIRSSPGTNTLV